MYMLSGVAVQYTSQCCVVYSAVPRECILGSTPWRTVLSDRRCVCYIIAAQTFVLREEFAVALNCVYGLRWFMCYTSWIIIILSYQNFNVIFLYKLTFAVPCAPFFTCPKYSLLFFLMPAYNWELPTKGWSWHLIPLLLLDMYLKMGLRQMSTSLSSRGVERHMAKGSRGH